MMSAIVILVIACACLGYSSTTNRARALESESELFRLKKIVDAGLTKKTSAVTEKKKPANPPAFTNPDFANTQTVPTDVSPTRRGGGGHAMMENLKETDPEGYATMVERRNSFIKRMQDNSTQQVEFLKKLDTKSMTPEQLDNHNKLLPLVNANNQLLYELAQNPEAENASEMRQTLQDNSRQMRSLLDTERSVALQQFAKQIGYGGDQAAQFEASVKKVYDMTSANPFQVGGRGGGNNRGQDQPNTQ